jgi:2-methylcitrate dehydratase PrpD
MARAERIGGVNGKELLTAICLGNDLVCRMGRSIEWKLDWHITPVFGVFGATLSCGKLLGFNEVQYLNSLGIALSQASTTMEVAYSPGSELRGMYAAFPAKGAVLAALMGDIGIAGPSKSFGGRAGLYNVYFNGEYDSNQLIDNLGKRFEHLNTSFKPWPSCRETHPYIDATLSLIDENNIKPKDIEEVLVLVAGLAERCSLPLDERRKPISTLDAKFSVPFSVAVALVKGQAAIEDFTPEGIKDPAVLEIAEKINARHEPSFDIKGVTPGQVDIKTKSGQVFSKLVQVPRGNPGNPMTTEEIIKKFKECMAFSAKPIPESNIEQAIDTIMNLESMSNVEQVMCLLC